MLTLPTGGAKIGDREYRVSMNSSPEAIAALNDIPIRTVTKDRATRRQIFVKDVAYVHDGYAVQTNVARRAGKRSVVLSVMKTGGASTTDVGSRVKELVATAAFASGPTISTLWTVGSRRPSAPPGLVNRATSS
jgi:multidrug efflux pump subunit AcrB